MNNVLCLYVAELDPGQQTLGMHGYLGVGILITQVGEGADMVMEIVLCYLPKAVYY